VNKPQVVEDSSQNELRCSFFGFNKSKNTQKMVKLEYLKLTNSTMIVRAYTQRSLFQNVIPEKLETLDPELAKIDRLLDREEILDMMEAAFISKRKHAKTKGRKGFSMECILRTLLIKHIFGWSFEETIRELRGSFALREFTRLYDRKAPHVRRLKEWALIITPDVVKEIHETVVKIAREKKVTRGRKLRTDTTVVETDIHYPTDSSLLSDAIRKICKTMEKIKEEGVKLGKYGRNMQRKTKRIILNIVKFARSRQQDAKNQLSKEYQKLIIIAKELSKNIKAVKQKTTRAIRGGVAVGKQKAQQGQEIIMNLQTSLLHQMSLERLKEELDHWKEMMKLVLKQTEERIINGNTHYKEKILSIFEPHSEGIQKGKAGKPIEFGRKVEITESENKIISDYNILDGNPYDGDILPEIVDSHIDKFGRPPDLVSGDRGNWKKGIEETLKEKGVKKVSIPCKGKKTEDRKKHEKQRWFKNGQRFRAGSEGIISKLKRRHRLRRCRYKGESGMERWVGLGVIASNLRTIAAYSSG
jgi:transposase, IS5 family